MSSSSQSSNPLKRFPCKSQHLTPYFRSLDSTPKDKNVKEVEKRERWLQMDRLDPNFGITGSTQEVFIRRSYRRMESSNLFFPPRMGASLAELGAPPPPENRRFILVQESRLRELAQIEAILREEREQLGEQCLWILSDHHIDARIPVPATRVAVNNLCDADMRRLAGELDVLQATWRAYYKKQHYDRDEALTAVPKKSYLSNAPLFQRPAKLVLLLEEQAARQLKRERDTMLFEDDLSFLMTAYHRASARKKDYERYFILATRYGHMSEFEFAHDERPGRRYWVRAIDGCLKFQRIWGAYWAVQSFRRYKGAKLFQKVVRAYLTYKKFHPIIIFRLKYGKSSYLKNCLHLWRAYVKIIKMCRESITFFMENWATKCLAAWKVYTVGCRDDKHRIAAAARQRSMNAGLVRTFHAIASHAKRQKYVKMKARRLLGCPHFDMWCEYVAISKYIRRQFRAAAKFQSIVRMHLARRQFRAKRCVGRKLGLVMHCHYVVDQLRNVEVRIDYKQWKEATQESRAMALSGIERSRLETMQASMAEREKNARKDLRRHLKSSHGRVQLQLTPSGSILQSAEYVRELAEKDVLLRCAEFHRKLERHDFGVRFPPAFRCVDPECSTIFTSEDQYHSHFKLATNHRPRPMHVQPSGPHSSSRRTASGPSNSSSTSPMLGDVAGCPSNLKLRKRLSSEEVAHMRLKDRERVLELRMQAEQQQYDDKIQNARAAASDAALHAAEQVQKLVQKEQSYKEYKASYVVEVKQTKLLVQGLELSTKATRRQEISDLNKAMSEKGRAYASSKMTHLSEVTAMEKQCDELQANAARLAEALEVLDVAFREERRVFEEGMAVVDSDRAVLEQQTLAASEAARLKKQKEEEDFKATLSYSSLHCLLLHPKEFQILRRYLLNLLPTNVVILPLPPSEEVLSPEQLKWERTQQEALRGVPVIRVKGWLFVKGKGWVMTKKKATAPARSSTKTFDVGKDVGGAVKGHLSLTGDFHARHDPDVASSLEPAKDQEPPRDNAMPEVHLLNCLDLWAAIQRWKTSTLSKDAAYTADALGIYETFLRGKGECEGEAAGVSNVSHRKSKGRGIAIGRLWSLVRHTLSCLLRWSVSPLSEDSDCDSGSGSDGEDYESDSDDDEAAQDSKRKARALRQAKKERMSRPIVRRTVDVRFLDTGWPQGAIDSMLARLEVVYNKVAASKRPGRKPDKTSLYHPQERPPSCIRKALSLSPGSYMRWTEEFVLPPDIFDGLQWALFQYIYEKVHKESSFEKSPDFMHYRLVCAAEDAELERLLFKDAKAARMDKFRAWARDEYVGLHRAQYRLAETCAEAALEHCTDSLLALAIKVTVGERVWQMEEAEQARHEAAACLSEDVAYWIETALAVEWFDNFVDPYLRTLLSIPDMRIKLLVFTGMREYDGAAAMKRRMAFDMNSLKESSGSLLDSFMTGDAVAESNEGKAAAD